MLWSCKKNVGTFSRCFCPLNWPFFRGGAFSQNWGAGPSILGKGRWPVNYKWFVIERLTFEPTFLIWFKKYRSPRLLSLTLHSLPANKEKNTKRQTQRQIQRQTHTHKYKNTKYTITKRSERKKSNVPTSPPNFRGTKFVFGKNWYLGFQRSNWGC